jgi:Ca-activated chloride channel family protein
MIRIKFFLPFFMVCFGFISKINAQSGQISGKIAQNEGKILSSYRIYLEYESGLMDSCTSDGQGAFRFENLPEGIFKLKPAPSDSLVFSYATTVILPEGARKEFNLSVRFREKVDSSRKNKTSAQENQSPPRSRRARKAALKTRNKQISRFTVRTDFSSGSGSPKYSAPAYEMPNEDFAKVRESSFKSTGTDPLSTFSIDVDRAAYSICRSSIQNGSLPPQDAVRVEEFLNYFDYDYPSPTGKDPVAIFQEYAICPWDTSHRLAHIGIQARKVEVKDVPPSNLVFLIDVSGSMDEPNKLPLLKSSLKLLVQELRPQDHVAIVVYASREGLALPSTPGSEKQTILDAISSLDAGGSTAGQAGILLAYKVASEHFLPKGNNRIILATDGDFNVGVNSVKDLEDLVTIKRKSGIYLTVLGFGRGNLKDDRMETLADKGNGNYAYIDNLQEGRNVLVSNMTGTLYTVARDVKIQVEFNPDRVQEYRLIGYENRRLNNEDFADDTKDAGEIGAGHTVTALYEVVPGKATGSGGKLRYHQQTTDPGKIAEVFHTKVRYKLPSESTSREMTQTFSGSEKPMDSCNENLRFSSAVAEFGMWLRDSAFKGNSSPAFAMARAEKARSFDEKGDRKAFIELVRLAEALKR